MAQKKEARKVKKQHSVKKAKKQAIRESVSQPVKKDNKKILLCSLLIALIIAAAIGIYFAIVSITAEYTDENFEGKLPPIPINTDVNTFIIRKGDGISYKGASMTVDSIINNGKTVVMAFPDGSKLEITGINHPVTHNGLEFEINDEDYKAARTVTLYIHAAQ